MNVQIMQMDPRIAAIHYKDYRKKVREHKQLRLKAAEEKIKEGGKLFRAGRAERSLLEKEDEVLMQSYREMSKGMRLVNVASAIVGAGLKKDVLLPELAIARADWTECYLHVQQWGDTQIFFAKERWLQKYGNGYKNNPISFPGGMFPAELTNTQWRRTNSKPACPVKTVVPSIPVQLRPAGDLSQFCILWEVEKWDATPPVDPLLLKHVSGHFYTVLAQWDLTPLERAVLSGRIG